MGCRPLPELKEPARPLWDSGAELIESRRAAYEAEGLRVPFFTPHEGFNGATVVCDGREYINFSGYNYLGLSGHPAVSAAAREAIDQYGTSVGASRIVSGEIPLHRELESGIAQFLGTEDALVFISGYGTNAAVISHVVNHRDLVIHDELAHNSIVTGCLLSHARRLSFRHNDWAHLDEVLTRHRDRFERVLIVIEGVYSMDGDIPDLKQAVAVKQRHDALLMVDEAHSLGVLGASGRGVAEHAGVERNAVDIWMGTLSKALASTGGFVAGSAALVTYLKYSAPGFLFSVGLSAATCAAALAALRILQAEPQRVGRLQELSALFIEEADRLGFPTGYSYGTPIVPILLGDSRLCLAVSQQLLADGIHVQPIMPPAVSEKTVRLRFFITNQHTPDQIDFTLHKLAAALAAAQPAPLTVGSA